MDTIWTILGYGTMALFGLGFVVSAPAIVFPYGELKTRGQALGTTLFCLVVFTIAAALVGGTDTPDEQIANKKRVQTEEDKRWDGIKAKI